MLSKKNTKKEKSKLKPLDIKHNRQAKEEEEEERENDDINNVHASRMRLKADFKDINAIATNFYQWNALALTILAAAILINLDLHFIPGAMLTLIAITMIFLSFILCSYEYFYMDAGNYRMLYKVRVIGFWLLRLILMVQIPFLLWVVVIMFERVNITPVACPGTCP